MKQVGKKKAKRMGKLHMGSSPFERKKMEQAFITRAEQALTSKDVQSAEAVAAVEKLIHIAKMDMPPQAKDKFFEKAKQQLRDWMKVEVALVEPSEDVKQALRTASPESLQGIDALEELVKVAHSDFLSKGQKDHYFAEVRKVLKSRAGAGYVEGDEHRLLNPAEKEMSDALLRAVEEKCGVHASPQTTTITVDDSDISLEEARRRGWKEVGLDEQIDLTKGNKFHIIKKDGTGQPKSVTIDSDEGKASLKDTFSGKKGQEAIARMSAAMKEFGAWQEAKNFVLQANECSRMHKMIESVSTAGTSVIISDDPEQNWQEHEYADWKEVKTFVVKHDWLAAFGDSLSTIADAELYLPYPAVAFEFKLSNRVMIALVQTRTDNTHNWMYFAETSNGVWIAIEDKPTESSPSLDILRAQVKAICVMLDSKVAETQVVRQPTALNDKRAKTGKLPLYDYHVVDLSRRHRTARPLGSGVATGRHVRCHFRRGHWRHFEKHRTWINWMLVGDPDLGFVEKEYKL